MALAGRLDIETDGQGAVAGKCQPRAFERRAAGMLQHAGNADAAISAALFCFTPPRFDAVIVGERQRLVEDRRKVAAIIGGADGGFVRHGGLRNEIVPPQLRRIDPGHARRFLDDAFEHVVRFRPAGTAVGRRRNGIGEGATRADVHMRDVVHARQAAGKIKGRNIGADGADISAEIADVADAQRQKSPLVVEGKLGFRITVARLVVAEKGLRAARHPMNRPAELLGADHLRDVFRIRAGLEPERAADIVGEHAHALLREFA